MISKYWLIPKKKIPIGEVDRVLKILEKTIEFYYIQASAARLPAQREPLRSSWIKANKLRDLLGKKYKLNLKNIVNPTVEVNPLTGQVRVTRN